MDLDAQCVNIGGVGAPTASAVLFVANNAGCHSARGFLGCCNSVAIVLRIEAPGGLLKVAGLKQKAANQNWIGLHLKGETLPLVLTFQMQPLARHLLSSALSSGWQSKRWESPRGSSHLTR